MTSGLKIEVREVRYIELNILGLPGAGQDIISHLLFNGISKIRGRKQIYPSQRGYYLSEEELKIRLLQHAMSVGGIIEITISNKVGDRLNSLRPNEILIIVADDIASFGFNVIDALLKDLKVYLKETGFIKLAVDFNGTFMTPDISDREFRINLNSVIVNEMPVVSAGNAFSYLVRNGKLRNVVPDLSTQMDLLLGVKTESHTFDLEYIGNSQWAGTDLENEVIRIYTVLKEYGFRNAVILSSDNINSKVLTLSDKTEFEPTVFMQKIRK